MYLLTNKYYVYYFDKQIHGWMDGSNESKVYLRKRNLLFGTMFAENRKTRVFTTGDSFLTLKISLPDKSHWVSLSTHLQAQQCLNAFSIISA